MKTLRLFSLMLLCALCACSSSDDDEQRDMTQPQISSSGGVVPCPLDCQQFRRGSTLSFCYVFTDDTELGSYNIEVHNNFDHHTHSTSSVECEMDAAKKPVKPWIFNQDYTIPSGQRSYTARINIPIPADIDTGDYHFMIRLTDRAGWQQLKGIAVKVVE